MLLKGIPMSLPVTFFQDEVSEKCDNFVSRRSGNVIVAFPIVGVVGGESGGSEDIMRVFPSQWDCAVAGGKSNWIQVN